MTFRSCPSYIPSEMQEAINLRLSEAASSGGECLCLEGDLGQYHWICYMADFNIIQMWVVCTLMKCFITVRKTTASYLNSL